MEERTSFFDFVTLHLWIPGREPLTALQKVLQPFRAADMEQRPKEKGRSRHWPGIPYTSPRLISFPLPSEPPAAALWPQHAFLPFHPISPHLRPSLSPSCGCVFHQRTVEGVWHGGRISQTWADGLPPSFEQVPPL